MALCCLRPLFCYSFGCAEKTDGVIFEVNIMDAIGNTPLFELKNIFAGRNNVSVFAKAGFLNPSGSVKDRACIRYDWSAAWISRTALSALQREHRAEEDHPGIWRRNYRDRSLRGGRTALFFWRESLQRRIRINTFTRISTTTMRTGGHTIRTRRRKSGSRPKGELPIL